MSLRAIKKRDTQLISSLSNRPTLFKKSANATSSTAFRKFLTATNTNLTTKYNSANRGIIKLKQQQQQLGRCICSNPELVFGGSEFQQDLDVQGLLRSRSESNLATVKIENKPIQTLLLTNAKSEICLESISAHSYEQSVITNNKSSAGGQNSNMLTGAHSHRDLTQSTLIGHNLINDLHIDATQRRMSECSLSYSQNSGSYLQRSGSIYTSQNTLSSNDPNTVLRVPIIGYEVMEERARFTVYKLRVENPATNDCWLVLRRYTDFVRLNSKLKQAFPHITLLLPRKKLFGDNFNVVFLDSRVQGLQIFVNSVMAKEELRNYKLVREFFCLDEPPSYSESMEECRAIFEAQEETISHLKLQIQNKNDLILNLQRKLLEEKTEKEQLREAFKNLSLNCSHCSSANTSQALH